MTHIAAGLLEAYRQMARALGWRRFMEGMISSQMVEIQREFLALCGSGWKLAKWKTGLVTHLLEITHGQWLYRNVVVHDRVAGRLAITRKEEIVGLS